MSYPVRLPIDLFGKFWLLRFSSVVGERGSLMCVPSVMTCLLFL